MSPVDVLKESLGRLADAVPDVVDGLTEEQLTQRVGPRANTIAWLVWHLTRVQDDHVADVAGTEQVWTAQGFARDFDLPFDDAAHGYGMSVDEVGEVRASAEQLTAYYRATHAATLSYLDTLGEADLDRVVDDSWDPPVTLGVRLASVVNDDTQHLGQAAFVRGLLT